MSEMNITKSQISPHISIQYQSPEHYHLAENALRTISKGNAGKSLINEIRNNSVDGKSMQIEVNNYSMTVAYPKLTESQLAKFGVSDAPLNKEHNNLATSLANKKSFGRKGEGTSSVVVWNPSVSVHVENGKNIGLNDENESFISLAHEMIHGYRMMKGTYLTDGSDRHNLETKSAEEEARTVGLGNHAGKAITENAIRREHGFELRARYKLDENDIVMGL